MEYVTMGRVLTEASIENLEDLWAVRQGTLSPDQARRFTVPDALVDTGATMVSLPTQMIRQLGLVERYRRKFLSSNGHTTDAIIYGTIRLTIQGRDCPTDVVEVADNVPVLIGQIPLEYLDLVVDLTGRRLIGNPAHGGEQMFEMY